MKKSLLLVLLLGCLSFNTKAEDPTKLIHNRQTYVDDYADIFTPEQEAEMDRLIKEFKKKSTVEFSIVSVNNLNGLEVDDFAQQLFTSWGIGGTSNNGCLILISVDPRKLRTHTGYGLEGDLTDYTTKKLQESVAVPLLKENKRGEGVLALLTAYLVKLDPVAKEQRRIEEEALAKKAEIAWNRFVDGFFEVLVWIGVIAVVFLIVVFFKKRQEDRRIRKMEEERRLARIQQEKEDEEERQKNTYYALKRVCDKFKETIKICKDYKPGNEVIGLGRFIDKFDFSKTDPGEIVKTMEPIQIFVNTHMKLFTDTANQISDILSDLKTLKDCDSKAATYESQYNDNKRVLLKYQDSYPELTVTFPDISKNLSTIKYLQTEGEKMAKSKNYNKLDILVSNIDDELKQINHVIDNLDGQIVKIQKLIEQSREIPRTVKEYNKVFTNLLAYSFISGVIREQLMKGPAILDDIIHRTSEQNLLVKNTFVTQKYSEIEKLLKLGLGEVEKENARVAEIERRKRERLRAIQEAEEAERRRKRQQDDDDRRRRDSYSSSSYSSSYSSSSDSSSSDFGGGSSGGGGSSSDY